MVEKTCKGNQRDGHGTSVARTGLRCKNKWCSRMVRYSRYPLFPATNRIPQTLYHIIGGGFLHKIQEFLGEHFGRVHTIPRYCVTAGTAGTLTTRLGSSAHHHTGSDEYLFHRLRKYQGYHDLSYCGTFCFFLALCPGEIHKSGG